MATKKEERPKTGFDAPSIGVAAPKGAVMKRLKNGRITFVAPDAKDEKKQTKKK